MIPFNKPWLSGNELIYIAEAIRSGKISGNGSFTRKCHDFFEQKHGFRKCLLTTSCTDALEMAAILCDIGPGDEVIMPSYTFVSTANAFVLRGARIVFADSRTDHPGMDETKLEELITSRTKAIVAVHYAGVACDMDRILEVAAKRNLFVVEDAAQAVDSYYKGRPLGGLGHLGCFSFHETKNIQCGEGGMLVVNDDRFIRRSEIIWEKGTNRAEFYRGEVNKYGWVDIGSSFLPSEVSAAFLFAQLEKMEEIQQKRNKIWHGYFEGLELLEEKRGVRMPVLPSYSTNNAHMFYLVCKDGRERDDLISFLKLKGILSVFHYLSLHRSPYYSGLPDYIQESLPNSDYYDERLVRLPLFYELTDADLSLIIDSVLEFYRI